MVFAGKVIGFEYRKGIPNEFLERRKKEDKQFDYETLVVKFQVERWWKGEATTELFLVTDRTKNSDGSTSGSSCDYDFKEGESYLIYAYGKENELRTNPCTRTRPLNKTEDLKILGEGKEPIEKKDEPKSGKEVMLPSLPPLRTVRATFTAHGSSLSNASCETRRLQPPTQQY